MGKNESTWSLTAAVGAGVMLIVLVGTVAGVIQIAKRARVSAPAPALAMPAPPPKQAEIEEMRRERDKALEQIRAYREQAARQRGKKQASGGKCVGGILFATVDGELRNVGHCAQTPESP